jgi:hypothetical protein
VTTPAWPNAYHITHVTNVSSIAAEGLLADSRITGRGGPETMIGMANIKEARLSRPMPCFPEHSVGEFVPFNFCPRSVMLYVIYMRNSPHLSYRGGQDAIVHLRFDVHAVLDWADAAGVLWAFSTGNARAAYTEFHVDRADLGAIDWEAVNRNDWSEQFVKDAKQAELLVHQRVPFELVESIGVKTLDVAALVRDSIAEAPHQPPVVVERSWYY